MFARHCLCTISFLHHSSTAVLFHVSLNSPLPSPPNPNPVRLHPSRAAGGGGDDGDVRERDEIRHDRRKERQHDRNISRAAPDKRCWTRNFEHAACELSHRFIPSTCARTHTHTYTDKRTNTRRLPMHHSWQLQDAADCSGGVPSLFVHVRRVFGRARARPL